MMTYVVTATFKTEDGDDALTVHISVLRQPTKPRCTRTSFGVTGYCGGCAYLDTPIITVTRNSYYAAFSSHALAMPGISAHR
jgi:hypothetical protein